MGFMSTVKGWLNIGGVKVKLEGVSPTISRSMNTLGGKVRLVSKSDKEIIKLTYKLIMEVTTGKGDEKETKESVLGHTVVNGPIQIKAGEEQVHDFSFNYAIPEQLKDKGGMLGAVGKFGAFAAGEKIKYYVAAICDVKGTALDPSDKVTVTVVA